MPENTEASSKSLTRRSAVMGELIKQNPLEKLLTESKNIHAQNLQRAKEKQREDAVNRFHRTMYELARERLGITRKLTAEQMIALVPYMRRKELTCLCKGLAKAIGMPIAAGVILGGVMLPGGMVFAIISGITAASFTVGWEIGNLAYNFLHENQRSCGGSTASFFRESILKPLSFLRKGHFGRWASSYVQHEMSAEDRALILKTVFKDLAGDAEALEPADVQTSAKEAAS